ncbi:hypothetical protein ACFL0V_03600 [Nanoarchaeota archaeon]
MKKTQLSKIESNLKIGIEESILIFIILIELLDFFRIIPPVLEFVEKTIAIIAICYLFYSASPTKILFGHKNRQYDFFIIFSFFLLGLKTVIGFIISASEHHSILSSFYSFIFTNMDIIENWAFKLGVLILAMCALLLINYKVKKPSFFHIIHEDKAPETFIQKISHLIITYLTFIAFFILIFQLAFEWLATTVDAPIMVGVLILLLLIIKYRKKFKTLAFLERLSHASEKFYERVILMFQDKNKIAIAIVGILVLHILVEVGHFIIPYTTGLGTPWYFPILGPGHEPLSFQIFQDFLLATSQVQQFFILLTYIINILAVLMLFIAPAYIWYYLYKDKKIHPGNLTWLFFGAISVFFIAPVFRMRQFNSAIIMGTDITTQQIPVISNVFLTILVGLIISIIFYILYRRYPKKTTRVGFIVALIYFAFYLLHFFMDLTRFYIKAIILLLQGNQYIISLHMFLFLCTIILFYVGSYLLLIYEVYAKQKI